MNIILNKNIFLLLSVSMIIAKDSPNNWHSYWVQSSKAIIMDESNQLLLGSAAIVALGATQIDMEVKEHVQSHKILSDPISHFGDEMGGTWGHWILWSSIITSSKIKKESNKNSKRVNFKSRPRISKKFWKDRSLFRVTAPGR